MGSGVRTGFRCLNAQLRNAPAEEGEVIDLTLEGTGVLAPQGKRVLLPGALAGERVRYARRRRRSRYDEAELIEVLTPSPDRVPPRCEYFGTCGGCSLQHLSIEAQRAQKERALLDALARIGGCTPVRQLPAITAAAWHYRRRARLGVRHVAAKGRVLVGFRERHDSRVTDMQHCAILSPPIGGLLPALSALIDSLSLRARLPQAEVTVADNATALVLRVLDPPTADDLAKLRAFRDRHGLRLYLQPGGPDTLEALDPAAGDDELCYRLDDFGVTLGFGPLDFIQVHAGVNAQMVARVLAELEVGPDDRVLDLYCGIGNFTLPLATRAAAVTGVEGSAAMTAQATRNAQRNGIDNVQFVTADLYGDGLEGAWTRAHHDVVLLDPPRAGAAAVMPLLARTGVRRIVYVSCHPGTLARDVGLLVGDRRYRLEAAGIMDMFPHTSHVESMAVLVRR